ncbi:MAG: type II toxin-antitoxin system RelE/ParE family toxin [Xanthobacteraceae bacterium]
MKVRYSKTALRELDEIFAYIHERNRSAAAAVVDRIERLGSLIGELPFIGHLTDEEGVRMMPVVRYPFLIFYAVNDKADEVVILHVRHAARLRPWEGETSDG